MSFQISSVALIGSFRQHYNVVIESQSSFVAAGLEITTPKGTKIMKHGIPFVRFESDNIEWSDEMVQITTFHRILRADFVFTVAPKGYIGRTTCYEIGRIIQIGKPLYFSERPDDLPLWVPDSHISSAANIAKQIQRGTFNPEPLHSNVLNKVGCLERDLLNGKYNNI